MTDDSCGTKIKAAALMIRVGKEWDDVVIETLPPPNRHHHIISSLSDTPYTLDQIFSAEKGFITDKDVFLYRDEAYEFCMHYNIPLKRPIGDSFYQGKQLFSEDLW